MNTTAVNYVYPRLMGGRSTLRRVHSTDHISQTLPHTYTPAHRSGSIYACVPPGQAIDTHQRAISLCSYLACWLLLFLLMTLPRANRRYYILPPTYYILCAKVLSILPELCGITLLFTLPCHTTRHANPYSRPASTRLSNTC